jgi:hypothetical protein
LPRSPVHSTSTNPARARQGPTAPSCAARWRTLAAEGVRQFLDIGTGIPTKPNLHEVVQDIAPDARIVDADNDPVVLAHARALLVGTPEGTTSYLQTDLRDPGMILQEAAWTLDFAQPAAVILAAILQLISGERGRSVRGWLCA